MGNLQLEKLNGEEYLCLQEMLGNGTLMLGLRKIFAAEELHRLEGMKAEALGMARGGEIVKYAAEARVFTELEATITNRMERLAPQRR